VTIAKRPSVWDGMAGVLEVIWANHEAEYFCEEDWTTQISLKSFSNFLFWRMPTGVTRLPRHGMGSAPGARRSRMLGSIGPALSDSASVVGN
jgi:hypothetical protein